MKKIIAANLKMNMTFEEAKEYVKQIDSLIDSKNVIIFPSTLYLLLFVNKPYSCGSQNVFLKDFGSYTGEVSSKQLKSLGVTYTILGHSERRQIMQEDNCIINKKIINAVNNNLNVILCIGESIEEKNKLQTNNVLKNQLVNCLKNIPHDKIQHIIIAYEPIWAIGTNLIPTIEEITRNVSYIKNTFKKLYHEQNVDVLYGGSVNERNINQINKVKNISGVLVGGASLDAVKLNKIKEVVLE